MIKAFHYHEKQDDLWFFPTGHAQVVLYDLREDSKTKGETDVYYMGEDNPMLLLIPKGVAHGYRVLGETPLTIIYFTTMSYNPDQPDEKEFRGMMRRSVLTGTLNSDKNRNVINRRAEASSTFLPFFKIG